jgi:hypothetical protein
MTDIFTHIPWIRNNILTLRETEIWLTDLIDNLFILILTYIYISQITAACL